MHVEEQVKLWNIRHIVLRADEQVNAYRLPASGFIYTVRDSAKVMLDNSIHRIAVSFDLC